MSLSFAALRAIMKGVAGRAFQRHRIAKYRAAHGSARLNIGSGYNTLDGWLNVDLTGGLRGPVYMDAGRPFPFEDQSFDAILCEHMIEHVPKPVALNIVAESFRTLKVGGKIRIITPDLQTMAVIISNPGDKQVVAYRNFVEGLLGKGPLTNEDIVNEMFTNYGHQHIYSVAELKSVVEHAGFSDIREGRGGYPHDPIFAGVEGHPEFMGFENNAFEAFALEAERR